MRKKELTNTLHNFLSDLWVSRKKLHLTPLGWTTNVILGVGTRLGVERNLTPRTSNLGLPQRSRWARRDQLTGSS